MDDDTHGQQDAAESKPTDIQLLVNVISQQLEASQRREDRVVALLEHLCVTGDRDGQHRPTAGPADEEDGTETVPAAPSRAPGDSASADAESRGADEPSARVAAGGGMQPARAGREPAAGVPGRGDLDGGPGARSSARGAAGAEWPSGDPARSRAGPRLPAAGTPAPQLTSSASLREFEVWRSKFEGYSLLVGLDSMPPAQQRAALFALLDDDWSRIVRFSIPVQQDTPIQDIIAAMQQFLRRQRNVILDRRDFDSRSQQPGESFDEFFCTLKEIAAFCDFCTACIDERLRDRLVVGVSSEDARRRLLETPDLTLQSAADICRAAENAANSRSAIGGPASCLQKMSEYKKRRQGSRRGRASSATRFESAAAPASRADSSDSCSRCGAAAHREGKPCPASGRTCFKCGKKDHFSAMCRSRERSQSRRRVSSIRQHKSDMKRLPDIHVRGVAARSSPTIVLQLHRQDGSSKDTTWTPDTGAETSAVSASFARKMGLQQLHPVVGRLIGADGKEMDCVGTCSVDLQLGDVRHAVEVAVVKQLNGPLLSWHDCISLGILPSTFPQQIRAVEHQPATRSAASEDPRCQEEEQATQEEDDSVLTQSMVESRKPPIWTPRNLVDAFHGTPTAAERREHLEAMKKAFPKVFDSSTLREMSGGEMKIELTEDAVPFAITGARNIPFCWREEVKKQLDDLQEKKIIEPVHHPTEWCHPLVPVPKRSSDGSVSGCRLTVDFTKLNKFVKRPTHPVRGTHDAVASIERGARFFTKIDSKSGYHQVPIRPEDQDLTTFMTPWGRYRYRRAVMGLISSGDVYNQRGDQALGDVPRTCKVVDDVLAWDTTYNEHIKHVWQILQRCEDNGITLNGEKFVFGADRVEFCGYEISADGYSPDQRKTRAIAEFPRPGCVTDLRSFLGLVHQLGAFSPEISAASEPLRQLLRPKNAWVWTEDHTNAFNGVKKLLVSPPVLEFFDPARRTVLETDAARLKGLGFCLRQQDEHGQWKLVQCGSRFLSETESRYATIEVELLALTWAARKCSTYLKGMQNFEVLTDHRPLVPILNKKSLQDIENPRLQRLRELLTPYNFTACWRKGAQHNIPDALSRYPVDPPSSAEEDLTLQVGSLVARITAEVEGIGGRPTPFEDVTLTAIRAAAEHDPDMQALKTAIMVGFPDHKSEADPQIRSYWSVRDKLTVDDGLVICGHRLVIPRALRKSVLQSLHAAHQGEVRTKRRARQTVYWPGVDQDVSNVVKSCQTCQLHQPAQQKEPIVQEQTPSRVFEAVSADFFQYAGRTYLVYVDRLSGWPCVSDMDHQATAKNLLTALREMFSYTGVPVVLRTDGGPQFTAGITRRFLTKWGVQHLVSSPHYPQANGHAEAAVKAVKRLIKKTAANGRLDSDLFAEGLLELRNAPRSDGRSAAQVVFGHPLRSAVPAHHRAFDRRWQLLADKCDARAAEEKLKTAERYDSTAKPLPHLRMGQHVLVRDVVTGLWDRTGVISGIGNFRKILVRLPSGRMYWRNRRFLRPVRPLITEQQQQRQPQPQQQWQPQPEQQRQLQPQQQPLPQPPPQDTRSPARSRQERSREQQYRQGRDGASPPTASEASPATETSPVVPVVPRRSTRVRSRPQRLQVRWGTCTYSSEGNIS